MKTIQEINTEIMRLGIMKQGDRIPGLLKGFADSIIDKCAENFEITMEKCYEREWYTEMYDDQDGDPCHPVLVRQSIYDVKNLIK